MLVVSEVFYSIQGEGKTTGCPSVFVRLAGCNLNCGLKGSEGATWVCDSYDVWKKGKKKDWNDVLPEDCQIALHNGAHLIITGGEPMLQQEAVNDFIDYVKSKFNPFVFVEIETNGTIAPNLVLRKNVNQWNVSPKLKNSGVKLNERFDINVLLELELMNSQFKFVISNEEDWEEIRTAYFFVDRNKITLMPAGENREQLEQTKHLVAEICKNNYLRYTDRLHINIWDKKTGV